MNKPRLFVPATTNAETAITSFTKFSANPFKPVTFANLVRHPIQPDTIIVLRAQDHSCYARTTSDRIPISVPGRGFFRHYSNSNTLSKYWHVDDMI